MQDQGSLITVSSFLNTWRIDPVIAGVVTLLGVVYLHGVREARRKGVAWPPARTLAFLVIGLGTIVFATMSGLAVFRDYLLWPASTSNTLLLVLAPVGIALGDPVRLARAALSTTGNARLDRVVHTPVARLLMFPAVAAVLGVTTELVVYFTPYFPATLRSPVWRDVLWLQLIVTGMLFVVPIVSEDLLPAWCTYPARAGFSFLDGLLDALPGIAVMLTPRLIGGGWYLAHSGASAAALKHSQMYAGGLMLALSETLALPVLIAVIVAWVRSDAKESVVVDRALDLEELREDVPAPVLDRLGGSSSPVEDDAPRMFRPWWEVDPGPLAGRESLFGPRAVDDAADD